jgi:hypothetical protein
VADWTGMKQLKLRIAVPEDAEQIVDWLNANPANEFDPGILKYPTLQVLCSYNSEPVAYLPTQHALFLESVAMNPEASEADQPQALRDLVKGAELLASKDGVKEIYFLATDPKVLKIAVDHGFQQLPWPLLRLKL